VPDRNDEIRFIAAALRRLEQTARLIYRYFTNTQQTGDILTEITGQIEDRLEVIERTSTLTLAILQSQLPDHDREATGPLTSMPIDKRKRSLRKQLVGQYDALNDLEEQAALQGPFPRIETTSALRVIKERIEEIEAELKYFETL
jgi:hypothetical protein